VQAASEVNSLLINFKFYILTRVGCVSRAALINAIYEKALKLSSSAKQSSTLGETVNLMVYQRAFVRSGVLCFVC
jgi:hypothetical protein